MSLNNLSYDFLKNLSKAAERTTWHFEKGHLKSTRLDEKTVIIIRCLALGILDCNVNMIPDEEGTFLVSIESSEIGSQPEKFGLTEFKDKILTRINKAVSEKNEVLQKREADKTAYLEKKEVFLRQEAAEASERKKLLSEQNRKNIISKDKLTGLLGRDYNKVDSKSMENHYNKLRLFSYELKNSDCDAEWCRFPDINCPELTRVKLVDGSKLQANRVVLGDTEVVCCQAPLKKAAENFWRAALQNTNLIIDLTQPSEVETDREREPFKVHNYYPDENKVRKLPVDAPDDEVAMEIHCIEHKQYDDQGHLTLSTYKVIDYSGDTPKEKILKRLHYNEWPDCQAAGVEGLEKVINVINHVQAEFQGEVKPPFIHCRAGVGRTGTLAVGMAVMKMIEKGVIDKENYIEEIDKLVLAGRYQRGTAFVQRPEQYRDIILLARAKLGIEE